MDTTGLETSASVDGQSWLDRAPWLMLVLDAAGTITVAEGDATAAIGARTDVAVARSALNAARDTPRLLEALRRALSGQRSSAVVAAGDACFHVRAEPRRGSDGRVDGAVVFVVGGGACETPGQSELARRVLAQLPGFVWATDAQLRVTYVNSDPRMTKLSPRFVVGRTIEEVVATVAPTTNVAVSSHRAALAGEACSFRYDLGGLCYEVHIEPLRDERGRTIGCVGVGLDVSARRDAEVALARSEARLAEAQRVAHVGNWEWDIARDALIASDEMYRIYGVEPAQFAGTFAAVLACVCSEDREAFSSAVTNAVRTPGPFQLEHRIERPDGEVRMIHARGEVATDERGVAVRMLASAADITERWQASQETARAASLLRATIESTADGLLVVDGAGKIRAYNQRFLSLWGLTPAVMEQGEGAALDAVAAQLEDPAAFRQDVRDLYDQPEAEGFDLLAFVDGRRFERYSRPQCVGDEVVGRVWSFRDVTDRERMLRRAMLLADVGRLLASLDIEPALDAVAHVIVPFLGDACAIDLLADEGGPRRLLSIARDGTSLLAGSLPPAIFAGHAVIYAVGARSQLAVPLMARGRLLGALTLAARDGRTYTPADLDVASELARRIELALENARLYRKTQEALQAREEFLAIAAHEIRGPLTSLHLAVQSLQRFHAPPPMVAKALAIIEREDRALSRFVDELLDVSQARTGQLRFSLEEVDLAAVVHAVASRLSSQIARSGSSLSVLVATRVVGYWDRARIDQVIVSLLSNAIKFGLGRPIEVSVSAADDRAVFTVRDHGIGIAADRQWGIFQPFERAVSARHYGGLGLGLYIVRTIVEGLSGTVRVESTPGEGTTLIVELPLGRPT